MTVKIRSMTKNDKQAIMKILQATPEFNPSEVTVAEEVIDSYLDDPERSGYHIAIAKVNSITSGYICYGPTPLTDGTWDLYWAAVRPDKQGQGIGSALIEYTEGEISKAHGRMVIIETSSKSEYKKTRSFYMHHNYEITGRIPDFYAAGDDKIVLKKVLQ